MRPRSWLPPASVLVAILASARGATLAQTKARVIANAGDANVRPACGVVAGARCANATARAVVVEVQLEVGRYHDLDLDSGMFGFQGYLHVWWRDPRLAHAGTASGGAADALRFTSAESANVWKPQFNEIALPAGGGFRDELFEVQPDGSVLWSRPIDVSVFCSFASGARLRELPFDTQPCARSPHALEGMHGATIPRARLRPPPLIARARVLTWAGASTRWR